MSEGVTSGLDIEGEASVLEGVPCPSSLSPETRRLERLDRADRPIGATSASGRERSERNVSRSRALAH